MIAVVFLLLWGQPRNTRFLNLSTSYRVNYFSPNFFYHLKIIKLFTFLSIFNFCSIAFPFLTTITPLRSCITAFLTISCFFSWSFHHISLETSTLRPYFLACEFVLSKRFIFSRSVLVSALESETWGFAVVIDLISLTLAGLFPLL